MNTNESQNDQKSGIIIAHHEELILQAASKLQTATGIVPGIIKVGYKLIDSLVQVGSIQMAQ